jgi:hypothetical protein
VVSVSWYADAGVADTTFTCAKATPNGTSQRADISSKVAAFHVQILMTSTPRLFRIVIDSRISPVNTILTV